jgi:serine/threonine-protein kinase
MASTESRADTEPAEAAATSAPASDAVSSSGISTTISAPRVGPQNVADTMRAGSDSNPDSHGRLSSPELVEGSVLDNAYRVIRRIGGGAMGTVYLVEHTHLGRRFAAKVVASAHCADEQVVARLRNEARVASSIQHENLVDVTHLGQTSDGALFVVMELLEGHDLRHRLTDQEATPGAPWLPDVETRRIAREVLSGLHAAHEAGVVHRDLKPDNIFLATKNGIERAKIVDFGLSKISGGSDEMRLTRTGQIMGTPLYMAPEQTRGLSEVDRRADIYAMGVILYEMTTGRLPFEAKTIYDLIIKHATEAPPGVCVHRPELPATVEAVIMRCLEKDRAARFQTAADLLAAWEKAWSGAPASVRPPPATSAPPTASEAVPSRAYESGGALASGPNLMASGSSPSLSSSSSSMSGVAPEIPSKGLSRGRALGGLALLAVLVALGVAVAKQSGGSPPPAPVGATTLTAVSEPVAPPPVSPPVAPIAAPLLGGPQPVAVPADVRRRIETEPPGATVERGGTAIGTTPMEVVLVGGAPVELTLRIAGRRPTTRTITADDPPTITVQVEHAARRTGPSLPVLAPR